MEYEKTEECIEKGKELCKKIDKHNEESTITEEEYLEWARIVGVIY